MPTQRNTGGRTAANMGIAGAVAFLLVAWAAPAMGLAPPAGAEAAVTAVIGGVLQYIREVRA